AHEVGHYFVTRHHLFAVPFPLPEALSVLMNGLEDPRANAWIVGRYPGTARWLMRLDEEPPPAPVPAFIAFCRECAREPLRAREPPRCWRASGPRGPPRGGAPPPAAPPPPPVRPDIAADGSDPAARAGRDGPLPVGGVAGGRLARRAVLPRDADPPAGAGGAA